MTALHRQSDHSHTPCEKVNAVAPRKSAEIARFPKPRLPDVVEPFEVSAARLIAATFPGRSQHDVCQQAAAALGVSPDTIDRILSKRTKAPDPRILFVCLAIYQSKTGKDWPIGGGFSIRITQGGAE